MGDEILFSSSSLKEFKNLQHQRIFCKRPQILDIMETDTDGHVNKKKTEINLRYFKNPKPTSFPLNLNEGFKNYKFRKNNPFALRKIGKYLMEKGEKENDTEEKCKIYAERSALYSIMITPYNLRPSEYNDLTIHATKFNDIIYMRKIKNYQTHDRTLADSYHSKFKQYCFSDEFTKEPRSDLPIDENQQTYCVYRTQLKEFDISYSAEINGVISDHEIKDLGNIEDLNNCRFVSTKLLWNSSQFTENFEKHPKALKWWAQAYLSKTEDIYIGFKERDGRIQVPIKHISLQDLPKNQQWKPHICNAFLHEFLTRIQDKMSDVNCPYTVWEFQFKPITHKAIKYKIYEGKTEHSFFSDEFVQHLQNKK